MKIYYTKLTCEMHMFFNNRDKVEINFIKNSSAFHMLLKKVTHVIFID
jgi:hypothetical protein